MTVKGNSAVATKYRSKTNLPLVSVFMPVYNQEQYVAAALDSVLNQTYENYEIVISDDCSIDLTPNIVQKYAEKFPEKIRFYKLTNKNLGGDAHFELLLKKCAGDYVCMFSGDDLMYPEKISIQMAEILELGLYCHGHSVDCIDESGVKFSEINVPQNLYIKNNDSFIVNGVPAAATSWIVKKSCCEFNLNLGFLHDFDMIVRALREGRHGYVSVKKLGAYRISPTSWSRNLSWTNYWSSYSNIFISWIRSRMYSECLWLVFRILVRLPGRAIKIFKKIKFT